MAQSSKMRAARHQPSATNKKYQDQFFAMKKQHDQEAKKARDYKRKMDQLQMENKVSDLKVISISILITATSEIVYFRSSIQLSLNCI